MPTNDLRLLPRNGLKDMLLADCAENSNIFAANRDPERARPLGTTLEKHFPQGAFPFALDFSSPNFLFARSDFPMPHYLPLGLRG